MPMHHVVGVGVEEMVQSAFNASAPLTLALENRLGTAAASFSNRNIVPTRTISAGKFFWEVTPQSGWGEDCYAGLMESSVGFTVDFRSYSGFGQRLRSAAEVSLGTNALGVTANTGALSIAGVSTLQIWADLDNKEVWIGRGGNYGTGNPATRTNPHFYGWSGTPTFYMFFTSQYASQQSYVFERPRVEELLPGYEYV